MIVKKIIQQIRVYKLKFANYIFLAFLTLFASLAVIIYVFYIDKISDIDFAANGLKGKSHVITEIFKKQKNENINSIHLSCSFFTCFNVYRCGSKGNQLLVYVYPYKKPGAVNNLRNNYLIKQYNSILETIIGSKYYTSNPNEACIFVSSADTLNTHSKNISDEGRNHLIFDFMFNDLSYYNKLNNNINQAMFAKIGYTKLNYRKKFDISFPMFSITEEDFGTNIIDSSRKWLVISSQINIDFDIYKELLEVKRLNPNDLRVFNSCSRKNYTSLFYRCINHKTYKYPQLLQSATFCLVLRGEELSLSVLLDSLANKCVPVIIFDTLIMPFDEVLDWSRAAVFIRNDDLPFMVNILRNYSSQRIKELRTHGTWLYEKYFKSIKTITETTFDIIANRIFPQLGRNYYFWNEPGYLDYISPFFLPSMIPKNDGFTAVILTYDRIDLLFLLINKLSKVPSLTKILIVWNNEYKKPPRLSKWPKIYKQIKIIQTEKNLLSNRFYPFSEIETEAILSIDDDIIMLTEDEIEFAFEVWREFPDRLVGFPSRTHAWDNATFCWKYQSEWTNHVSMVLTGAAFYHKFWNYAYTTRLPADVREWVDGHMNCEDIAMNFLISNVTRKAPIKVTAKKKFRCPECINTEMLSADLTHMIERTQCINQFIKSFGQMPLMSVEFRADPVLFKDNFPDKLKRFNNIGSL